ncbi:perlucin-like [Haliotis rufescens]|uniref:perlucin-like n=1 Tax=Haliotis rufescens TaxID=6454 RepID=UPI00201F76FC|nr:perlucin-like [Haliotis rufescens]XP_048251021.1 perlucin-like [Haliotis rufescens]
MRHGTAYVLLCTFVSVVAVSSPCPPGFVEHKKSCYWFSKIKANFAEARSYCQYFGSHLARVTSRDEDDFVRGHATIHGKAATYWLGATDLNVEGTWLWEGQQAMDYSNWSTGQPDNYGGGEHCLDIKQSYGNYLWNDAPCTSHAANFICEKGVKA